MGLKSFVSFVKSISAGLSTTHHPILSHSARQDIDTELSGLDRVSQASAHNFSFSERVADPTVIALFPMLLRHWMAKVTWTIQSLLLALIPSFLRSTDAPKTVYPTTWLDGVRGYAAFLVFLCHMTFGYLDRTRLAYGTLLPEGSVLPNGWFIPAGDDIPEGFQISMYSDGDRSENRWFIQLPIVRLIFIGDPMVAVFFVVSGYALSLKPLRLIRRRAAAHAHLLQALASATLRRPLRLLLPCVLSTFIIALLARLGVYDYANEIAGDEATFRLVFWGWAWEGPPPVEKTFQAQMVSWAYGLYDMMDFFTHYHWTRSMYDVHLWTIPVEFRCSLLLFLTLLATALLRPLPRIVLCAGMILLACTWGDMWEMSLFWAGMLLCELDLIRGEKASSSGGVGLISSANEQAESRHQKRWLITMLLSLYLLSYPELFAHLCPLYSWVEKATRLPGLRFMDRWRIPHCVGSVLLVLCVSHCQLYRSFFSNRLARYLGRISYSLYLVHGPIIRSLGYTLSYKLWLWMGNGKPDIELIGQGRYLWAVALSCMVVIPVVVCMADLFSRVADEPIVRFSKTLEDKLIVKNE